MNLSRMGTVSELAAALAADSISARNHEEGTEPEDGRHRRRARKTRRLMERLGPFYIKVGQVLATRPDFVSDIMMDELSHLQDSVTAAPFSVFEQVINEELDGDWRRHFRSIDTKRPLGSASLAQAYRVTLHSGEDAVLKVQRPGIRATVLSDMSSLQRAIHFAAKLSPPKVNAVVDMSTMLGVVFDAMQPELDFTMEASTMDQARQAARRFTHISVPEVHIATPRLLLQSMAPGTSIRDADMSRFTDHQRKEIGKDLLSFLYHGYFIERMFHADPHAGNIFVDPDHGATLIDWGMIGRLDRTASTLLMLTLTNVAINDTNDMERMLPRLVPSSLDDLNFGVALMSVLRSAARRGIRSNPMAALVGKSFANIEGATRCVAPEIGVAAVFKEIVVDVMIELAREVLSREQACKFAMDAVLNSVTLGDQGRGLMRDITNREFAIKVGMLPGSAKLDAEGSLLPVAGLGLAGAAILGGWRLYRKMGASNS
jgi:ubiquinone biosynthesis protein